MYFKQNVYFALENHENPIGMDVYTLDFPGSSPGKESICNAGEIQVPSLGGDNPFKKEMGIHSSILAWRMSTNRASWWAVVHGAAKSQT